MSPRIESNPRTQLREVWVYLTPQEADELRAALEEWANEVEGGRPDPDWHTHVADSAGRQVTLAVEDTSEEGSVPAT